jgi:hypothetical protein
VSLRLSARAGVITRPSEEGMENKCNPGTRLPLYVSLALLIHFNERVSLSLVLLRTYKRRTDLHRTHVYANLSVHPLGT